MDNPVAFGNRHRHGLFRLHCYGKRYQNDWAKSCLFSDTADCFCRCGVVCGHYMWPDPHEGMAKISDVALSRRNCAPVGCTHSGAWAGSEWESSLDSSINCEFAAVGAYEAFRCTVCSRLHCTKSGLFASVSTRVFPHVSGHDCCRLVTA